MSIAKSAAFPILSRSALAACLATALGTAITRPLPVYASTDPDQGAARLFRLPEYLRWHERAPGSVNPRVANSSHPVTNCNDSGPGSLRAVIGDAATMSGDTVDLSQLAMTCSRITLGGAALHVYQDTLYLQGPASGELVIDANVQSSDFYHYGLGTLNLSNLTITNGEYTSSFPRGGCIYSKGSVYLTHSIVSNCSITSTSAGAALGGAIYAAGDLTLKGSTITGGIADAPAGARSYGGGAYVAGALDAEYSTISYNTASATSGFAYGGGMYTKGDVFLYSTTVSGNDAGNGGGMFIANGPTASAADIWNSTISSNSAFAAAGGITAMVSPAIRNSTIAFNRAPNSISHYGAGLWVTNGSLDVTSTIIADNSSAAGPSDLFVFGGNTTGFNNLILSSNLYPPGTIFACPELEPLADNGGLTRTHALRHASPAIDAGADTIGFLRDQRGAPRAAGAFVDIGSVERSANELDERIFAGGFDGLCDQ
jgi:hypothetical protein